MRDYQSGPSELQSIERSKTELVGLSERKQLRFESELPFDPFCSCGLSAIRLRVRGIQFCWVNQMGVDSKVRVGTLQPEAMENLPSVISSKHEVAKIDVMARRWSFCQNSKKVASEAALMHHSNQKHNTIKNVKNDLLPASGSRSGSRKKFPTPVITNVNKIFREGRVPSANEEDLSKSGNTFDRNDLLLRLKLGSGTSIDAKEFFKRLHLQVGRNRPRACNKDFAKSITGIGSTKMAMPLQIGSDSSSGRDEGAAKSGPAVDAKGLLSPFQLESDGGRGGNPRGVLNRNRSKEAPDSRGSAEGRDEMTRRDRAMNPGLPRKFSCPDLNCSRTFGTVEELRIHQWREKNTHFWLSSSEHSLKTCEACTAVLTSCSALEQHFVDTHPIRRLGDSQKKRDIDFFFRKQWTKKERFQLDRVLEICEIYNSAAKVGKYKTYRSSIAANSDNSGNEKLMFHGTPMLCSLGTESQGSKPCQKSECNLCRIVISGLKLSKASYGDEKFQRFGRGIYTTETSSKSDSYTKSARLDRRAVFLCHVAMGKVFKTQVNMEHLTSPPDGYDSVWGVPGTDLNYDEGVVYSSKSVLPAFIIFYSVKAPEPLHHI